MDMDDKKFQMAIDIILQNQAKFYAYRQQVQETNKEIQGANLQIQKSQTKAEKRTNVLERACINLYNLTVRHDDSLDEQRKSIDALTADIGELREAQKETGERLYAVIFMAEKFFSGQNGKSKK